MIKKQQHVATYEYTQCRTEINQVQRFVLMEKCLCLSSKLYSNLHCLHTVQVLHGTTLTFKVNYNGEYLDVVHTDNLNDKEMVPT